MEPIYTMGQERIYTMGQERIYTMGQERIYTMGQERLNHLAMISIESKIVADLNNEDMQLKLSHMKARRVLFSR